MNPIEAIKTVDQLADKDFRWWFLAMLVVVLAGGILVVRHLVKRSEIEREQHHSRLDQMMSKVFTHSDACTAALTNAVNAMNANTEVLRDVKERL